MAIIAETSAFPAWRMTGATVNADAIGLFEALNDEDVAVYAAVQFGARRLVSV